MGDTLDCLPILTAFRGQIVSPSMHAVFREPQENKKPSGMAYLAVWLFAYQVKYLIEKPLALI